MIARLLISPSLQLIKDESAKILASFFKDKNQNYKHHPDILYFPSDSKLGVLEAKKIKEHFSLKPYQSSGRAVVLEDAASLTTEAQNALLKTIEELPKEAIFILGAASDSNLLPTIVSRCEIVRIKNSELKEENGRDKEIIEELLKSEIEERFEYIEKLKEREKFLNSLIQYFHSELPKNSNFTKELLQAEEWANQNVNIRAILEYLMLKMPRLD